MDHFIRDTQTTHTLTLSAEAGGTITAEVFDSAGTSLATPAVSHTGGQLTYSITLTAANNTTLDRYSVVWTESGGASQVFTTYYEVVGGFYFTIAELRAWDADLTVAKYSDAKVIEAREAAEERLEQLMGVSYVPRGRRVTQDGTGTQNLYIEQTEDRPGSHVALRTLVSGSIDGTALTATQISDAKVYDDRIWLENDVWTQDEQNVTVLYEYGYDQPPEPVRRAAMKLAKEALVRSGIPDRASAESTELGTISFTLAGKDGPTGIPEVDAVIAQYGRSSFRVA